MCANDPCPDAENANVTCMSVNDAVHECSYQCVAENFEPIEGIDARNGCKGNYIPSKIMSLSKSQI